MDQVLHIAIITNDHIRAEALARLTQDLQWQLIPCVGQSNPLDWLRRRQVDVVLLDLESPNALANIGTIANVLQHVPLLVLVTPQHLTDLQEALVNGAAGFVAFPAEREQFMSVVMRAVQSNEGKSNRSRRGRIVSLAGLKGGVGRSTLAADLSVALRQAINGDVIVVEAHSGLSDLSLMLNLLPHHTISSLLDEDSIDQDIVRGLLYEHSSGVRVLAAPSEANDLVELSLETWRQTLEILSGLAPYVFIDTAAVADGLLSEVLTMSDDVLVITGPDVASLRSAVVLLNSLDTEPNVHARSHVVLNRAGVRGGVSEKASREQLGQEIASILPDDPSLATFALNRGVPFVLSHPRSILTREVLKLTEQLFNVDAQGRMKESNGGRQGLRLPFVGAKQAA